MATESEFLDWLYSQQCVSDFVQVAAGDDLAVLKWKSSDLLLVGIDQVLDGVHFDSKIHAPRLIGRKAMNRNISDCAAMACLPAAAVASVALPRGTPIEFARELYLGLRDAADVFDCHIVGGDTSAWDGKLAISVAILGRTDGIKPITRRGARPGDGVFVTGALGGSIAGRHLTFEPRVTLARELASRGIVTAMIDISDGLARDLRQICAASEVGAVLDASRIPIHPDVHAPSRATGRQPFDHAIHDGEDHELLFTASSDPNHACCVRIGSIDNDPTVRIDCDGQIKELPRGGWEAKW